MTYADGKEKPALGDKVLGDGLKGVVADVKKDTVVVRVKGPWDPKKKPSEIRREVDPAKLTLIHRAPDPSKAPTRPVIRSV